MKHELPAQFLFKFVLFMDSLQTVLCLPAILKQTSKTNKGVPWRPGKSSTAGICRNTKAKK